MLKITAIAAGALALLSYADCRAADDTDGYRPERAAMAAQMPVYIVVLNARVRPQMDYPRMAGATVYVPYDASGMSYGQMAAVGVVGGVLSSVLAEAMIYAESKQRATAAYAPVLKGRCDLVVDTLLQQTLREAMARAPWGANVQPILIDGSAEDWDKQIPKDRPRQVFTVTSSLTPGLGALLTSLDLAAYSPEGEASGTSWQKKPLWRDQFIVVSDVMVLPAKTDADRARMAAQEDARYAESGDLAVVAKVAKDIYGAGKSERMRATAADRLHKSNLKLAREANWSLLTEGPRRGELWSQDDCAPMRAAVTAGNVELGRMLDDLYAQRLPPRLPSKHKTKDDPPEPAGERKTRALPGGVYVSRNEAGTTALAYRYRLLPQKQDQDQGQGQSQGQGQD